ncbi:Uma2 family endonuclease [Spinactinospora alkalitolerans]|uniref:Uma2 family endonuclease n=1 Tax=Spinactinospora alkalitolerans TaxID=687207 RepID=A0A852TVC5_9ACTN|nr:Uma2 family endonuclease [Spinactinospora alkalitolerans]NYE46822.1 Uma2 family endonuclease [Spinactinospora alkalitolerans]
MAMPVMVEPDEFTALELAADQVEVPQGYRVEIIEGKILVSASPAGIHALLVRQVRLQLERILPSGMVTAENVTVALPVTSQRYIPDLVVCPEELLDTEEWTFPANEVLLALEVTSRWNADIDREVKPMGYAFDDVGHYLLVDRGNRSVTLFSEPEKDAYRRRMTVPFGEALPLPDPFDAALDTAGFK